MAGSVRRARTVEDQFAVGLRTARSLSRLDRADRKAALQMEMSAFAAIEAEEAAAEEEEEEEL